MTTKKKTQTPTSEPTPTRRRRVIRTAHDANMVGRTTSSMQETMILRACLPGHVVWSAGVIAEAHGLSLSSLVRMIIVREHRRIVADRHIRDAMAAREAAE